MARDLPRRLWDLLKLLAILILFRCWTLKLKRKKVIVISFMLLLGCVKRDIVIEYAQNIQEII